MSLRTGRNLRRRTVIKAASALAISAGAGPFIRTGKARAASKTLRILQWAHFVPGYDKWFNNDYIKAWGQQNDTEVIVDNIGLSLVPARAAAEVATQKGHDLFLFLSPPPVYEDQAVDMTDVYEEVSRKHGRPIDLAIRSTYNPKTKKYFAFSDSFVPSPINYRLDLWDDVGVRPDSWDDIRLGGKRIKAKHGIPVGIGLAPEFETATAVRTIMSAHGAAEQDADGNLRIRTKETLDALRFAKALFQDTMTADVLAWDPSSNNRAMIAGESSLVLNAISITREAENKKLPIRERIGLAKAAKGPVRAIGLAHVVNCYVIWKFAGNIDGAKKFLVDYIDNFQRGFEAGGFSNFPCFSATVKDLPTKIAMDRKYAVLGDAVDWTTNLGYPGYATAAIEETFNTWTLNTMFAKAATGALSPEDALSEADAAMQRIWTKWKGRGAI